MYAVVGTSGVVGIIVVASPTYYDENGNIPRGCDKLNIHYKIIL